MEGAQDESEAQPGACRILILGDGNFSFSLALARALPPGFEIVATSFDGPVDLLGKYPESPGIVAALRSLGVAVLHNVDATALDARVVEAEVTSGDGFASPAPRRQYEHVIFNHPHTGTEDMRRHRSFLGHFFHAVAHSNIAAEAASEFSKCVETSVGGGGGGGGSASSVADRHYRVDSILAPGGAIHVTLALEQPERWGLQEQAARHGFSLAHRRRFPAEQIDGYMTKRHQTGRSFQQRVQNSETLSFIWASRVKAGEGEPGAAVFAGGCGRSGSDSGDRKTCTTGGIEVVAPASATSALPPWLRPDVNMSGKPGGFEADGNGGGGSGPGAGPSAVGDARPSDAKGDNRSGGDRDGKVKVVAAAVLLPEACELCGKRYKTPQALRTHVRQFHELGQEGGVPLAEKKEEPCPHCGRTFTSSRALDQHVLAKHSGNNVDIKPDWFVGSIYHLEPPPQATNHGSIVTGEEPVQSISAATPNQTQLDEAADAENRDPHAPTETVDLETTGSAPEAKLGTNNESAGAYQECDICGYWFASPADAQQHLDNLRPPIEGAVTRYDCRTCAKDFGSRRALLQHANFCGGGRSGAGAGRA
eukprot:g14727.t1